MPYCSALCVFCHCYAITILTLSFVWVWLFLLLLCLILYCHVLPCICLQFGKEEVNVMPEFISQQMPQLVYKLLADAQLTVREHTIKAYSLYISRSEFKVHTGWPDKMVPDKMVWTKWYGQNGMDKMVAIFGIDYNSSELNTYLISKSNK